MLGLKSSSSQLLCCRPSFIGHNHVWSPLISPAQSTSLCSSWSQFASGGKVAKFKNQAIQNKNKNIRHCAVLRDMTSGFSYYFGLESPTLNPPPPPPPPQTQTEGVFSAWSNQTDIMTSPPQGLNKAKDWFLLSFFRSLFSFHVTLLLWIRLTVCWDTKETMLKPNVHDLETESNTQLAIP